MQLPQPLHPGVLVRRTKRFLADVHLEDGRTVTAHCPNSGSMLGLATPDIRVWLSYSDRSSRRLPFGWELAEEADGTLVGINTQHPNKIVAEAIAAGVIPALAGYDRMRREVPYGESSRVDLLLQDSADRQDGGRSATYVEVKNVHLRRRNRGDGRAAEFPDCVTARGTKHVRELTTVARRGERAVLLFLVQRNDCDYFRVADDLDPAYAAALKTAVAAGVEILCFACRVSHGEIGLGRPLPVAELEHGPVLTS